MHCKRSNGGNRIETKFIHNMNKKYIIITVICTALSIILGILTKDLIN